MMPWSHLAVGYVCFSVGTRVWNGRAPPETAVLVLAVATQLPDLVDKPLDVLFYGLEGRSFMHSFVFVVPLCLAVLYLANRRNRRELGAAFGVGVLSHLPGDALALFRLWGYESARFLLWPVLPPVYYPTGTVRGYVHLLVDNLVRVFSPTSLLDTLSNLRFWLLVLAFALWIADDYPGLGRFRPN
jgi:membrane-bound metal-dependent hydrolase YbcI (DUF457 family)